MAPGSRQLINKTLLDSYINKARDKSGRGGVGVLATAGIGVYRNVTLKKNGRTVSWLFRYKGKQTTFAYSYPLGDMQLDTLEEAGVIADMLRREHDERGGMPAVETFIMAYHEAKVAAAEKRESYLKAVAKADVMNETAKEFPELPDENPLTYEKISMTIKRPTDTWTLRECVKKVIEFRSDHTHADGMKEGTIKDWNATFNKPEFRNIIDLPVAHLNREMLEVVRDAVRINHGPHPARKVYVHTSAVLKYCYKYHMGASGLRNSGNWWLELVAEGISPKRPARDPSLRDVARVYILAELMSTRMSLKANNEKKTLGPEVLDAFKFVILTGQRQGAVVQLRVDGLTRRKKGLLANWTAESMKGKRDFALPLPKKLIKNVPRLQDYEDRKYVFSSAVTKNIGEEIHVSRSSTGHVCSKLNAENLFVLNDINYFSPHDVRRTIGAVCDAAGIPGGASAMYAHEIAQNDDKRYQVARVTEKNYRKMQNLSLKEKALKVWLKAILKEIAAQRAAIENGNRDEGDRDPNVDVWVPVIYGKSANKIK